MTEEKKVKAPAAKKETVKKVAVKKEAAPKVAKPKAEKVEKVVAEKPVAKSAPVKKAAAPKTVAAGDKITTRANNVYATGKRKDSVARVYMAPGKGIVIVNGKPMNQYFKRAVLQMIIAQPFEVTKRVGTFDVMAIVSGGGLSGQAGAVKHGISKCLLASEPELRPTLRKAGFLTRDSRVVERKKPGVRKARRSTQFSKR